MMAPLLLLLLAPTIAASSCAPVSSVAVKVLSPCVDATDLYYVAVFADLTSATAASPKPLALTTTTRCSAVIEDLVASTSYYLRVTSHPAAAPSTVWNWRGDYTDPLHCTTAAAPTAARSRRGALGLSSVGVQWDVGSPEQADQPRARQPPRGAAAAVLHPQRLRLARSLHAHRWNWNRHRHQPRPRLQLCHRPRRPGRHRALRSCPVPHGFSRQQLRDGVPRGGGDARRRCAVESQRR